MEQALGTSYGVFFVVTVFVMGFAAYMTGQAMANTWKPAWQSAAYCILLGFADRFLTFALFQGELLSLSGYLIDTGVLIAFSLFAFRFTRTGMMVTQYPWLYERVGLLGWRQKR